MEVGDIKKCVVTGIKEYGFFIKMGDYKGMCHISEVSNDYVSNINDYVSFGEEIYVLIKSVDNDNKMLNVSIKDIYYRTADDINHIVETRKGFLPLKEMLPIWINNKINEYNKKI